MITDIHKIDELIESLKYHHNIGTVDYKEEYESLLVGIIGYSSLRQTDTLNKKIKDPQESIQATKEKVTASDTFNESIEKDENLSKSEYMCYMLTPDQLMAIKDPSSHIIIDGDYGCGKTYLLKERAKQCAQKYPDQKIVYINLTSNVYKGFSIMDIIAENNFKEYNNVDVMTATELKDYYEKHKDEFLLYGEDFSLVINRFLKHSTYQHIFIDEMPVFTKVNSRYDIFCLEKMYCVTMKRSNYDYKNKEWIKQMEERYNAKTILVEHNMRNSEIIVHLSIYFDRISLLLNEASEYLVHGNDVSRNLSRNRLIKLIELYKSIPSKNITGHICYHYHNIHELDRDTLARAAILKYFHHQDEPVVVLHDNSYTTQGLYEKLQKYFSTDRNVVYLPKEKYYTDYERHISEVKGYLGKPEGILVTDIVSFDGAQARNIIIIAESDSQLRNMIMRAMSYAIIIIDEDKESVSGIVRDDNLHEYIDPGNTEQLFCKNKRSEHRSICNWPIKDEGSASDSISSK